MPEVNITHTEVTPTYTTGSGGDRTGFTHTELNPTYLGGGGGGWRIFTATEDNPVAKVPRGLAGLNPPLIEIMAHQGIA